MFTSARYRFHRFVTAFAVAAAAVVVVGVLALFGAGLPNIITIHAVTFYGVTAAAYAALPFLRRGDVLLGAIWLVLVAGVGPCIAGQEISAPHMFADMAGVLLAAVPIYVARFRQVAQGDLRDVHQRRQAEREIPGWRPIEAGPDHQTESTG
ncbi:MAG: hypothetical protein ACJ798_20150 [Phenylobacterium sp.]